MTTRCERPARRPIDGLLLVDKPAGVTSNRALQSVRRLYRAEKAGHTGTLDPIATGLLPVLFGEATKFGSSLLDADKTYRAAIALGVTTTTADSEGQILERRPVVVTYAGVEQVLARFRGEIAQVPPMYSALKRDGRPLYEYARAGQSVDRAARPVTIHELGIDELASDELAVTIRCSKGTYVRVLAEEIGASARLRRPSRQPAAGRRWTALPRRGNDDRGIGGAVAGIARCLAGARRCPGRGPSGSRFVSGGCRPFPAGTSGCGSRVRSGAGTRVSVRRRFSRGRRGGARRASAPAAPSAPRRSVNAPLIRRAANLVKSVDFGLEFAVFQER